MQVQPLSQKIPWRRKRQPTPVFLPGKFHGQKSLAGYSPWDCKESDTTLWVYNNSNKFPHLLCIPFSQATPQIHSRTWKRRSQWTGFWLTRHRGRCVRSPLSEFWQRADISVRKLEEALRKADCPLRGHQQSFEQGKILILSGHPIMKQPRPHTRASSEYDHALLIHEQTSKYYQAFHKASFMLETNRKQKLRSNETVWERGNIWRATVSSGNHENRKDKFSGEDKVDEISKRAPK